MSFLGLSQETVFALSVLFTTSASELVKIGTKEAVEKVKQSLKKKNNDAFEEWAANPLNSEIQEQIIALLAQVLEDEAETAEYLNNFLKYITSIPPSAKIINGSRDSELKLLKDRLNSDEALLLVNGVGGIGKSSLASEYIKQYSDDYDRIAWVVINNSFEQGMLNHLQNIITTDVSHLSIKQQVKHVFSILAKNYTGNNLLVIDNANNGGDLIEWEDSINTTGWQVLITTRSSPDGFTNILPLDELSPEMAQKLFLTHYLKDGKETDENFTNSQELLTLLEFINYHTLLTELVAKAGKKHGKNLVALLELLKTESTSAKGLNISKIKTGIHSSFTEAEKQELLHQYILNLFELDHLEEQEKYYLRLISILPPEDIPQPYLKLMFGDSEGEKKDVLGATLYELQEKGWLVMQEENTPTDVRRTYKMHPLVQDVVAEKLEANAQNCEALIKGLAAVLENLNTTQAQSFIVYVQSVFNKLTNVDANLAYLTFYEAQHYLDIGQLEQALNRFTDYSELTKQLGEVEYEAISYSKLGDIHQALGDMDKAREYFEVEIQLFKELHESNPQSESLKNGLAISYSKLGSIHQALGDMDKAREYFEKRSELGKELHESNPQSESLKNGLAISYSKLGSIHQALGDMDKAREYYNKDLILIEELHESNPQSESLKNGLAISYSKLGSIHQALGDMDKAREYFEVEIQLFKELHEFNPQSESLKNGLAISYSKLGSIHQALGDMDKALEYYNKDLILTEELHESNPQSESLKNGLAISYSKLGEIHQALGQMDKALEYFTDEIQLFKELHESNPQSESLKNGLAISYEKLGSIHQALGDMDKAREYFEKRSELGKELHESNPQNIQLFFGLGVSYYKLSLIYQQKKEDQKFSSFICKALKIFITLYQSTKIESYKDNAEHVKGIIVDAGLNPDECLD